MAHGVRLILVRVLVQHVVIIGLVVYLVVGEAFESHLIIRILMQIRAALHAEYALGPTEDGGRDLAVTISVVLVLFFFAAAGEVQFAFDAAEGAERFDGLAIIKLLLTMHLVIDVHAEELRCVEHMLIVQFVAAVEGCYLRVLAAFVGVQWWHGGWRRESLI